MVKRAVVCALGLGLALGAALPSGAPAQTTSLGDHIRTSNDELFHKGNLAFVDDVFAPEYVAHAGGTDIGAEAIRSFVVAVRRAFPDLRVEITVLLEDGDRVAWLRTHRGTFKGDYRGVTATGRTVVWQDMVVTRYEKGKIAEEWGVSDFVERSQQR